MKAIASSSKPKSKKRLKPKNAFNAQLFLESAGVARRVVQFRKSEKVYAQGDAAVSVMHIQDGGIKITVVNQLGKEAVVAMLGPGDFFGEGVPGRPKKFAWGRRLRSCPQPYSPLKRTR